MRVSQTKGRKGSKESDAVQAGADSILDTQPGIPELDLKQTLPTGAAFHATWRMQSLTPNSLPIETQESGVHPLRACDGNNTGGAQARAASSPQTPAGAPPTSQPEAVGARAAAPAGPSRRPRALLAQTLQMPLTVTPVTTDQTESFRARPAQKPPASSAPPGWQSVQRIGGGDDANADAGVSRPAPKHTDPMHSSPRPRGEAARSVPPPLPQRGLRLPGAPEGAAEPMGRHSDYNRSTLPHGNVVRVPELSTREWMFIGLLLCASAATLYSLLVDDVTPAVEEDLEAATNVEHVVTPANGDLAAAPSGAQPSPGADPKAAVPAAPPAPTAPPPQPVAAVEKMTEIITDPPEAELLLGGAVVGNTPAKVGRSQLTTDYLLRKAGYEPQVVRVSPTSPDTITVTLHSRNWQP
jgi:hypothetical protein